jgi:hypothetical protein
MSKAEKRQPTNYKEKIAIKGDFLDVFKVVKKDKERKAKESKKKVVKIPPVRL